MKHRLIKSIVASSVLSVGMGLSTQAFAAEDAIKLWIAPNESQEAFWKVAVAGWNDSGNGMQVDFTTIPASGSSEEAILTAIASGNAPDVSTNIFSGFAAQLAELGQLVDISTLDGYDELIASRDMVTVMKGWENGGKSFVFPIYSNPILVWWRGDLLADAGFDSPPETYAEVLSLSEKISVPGEVFGMKVMAGKNWWDRWFDYISYYNAASNGAPYIQDGKAVYDNEAGTAVLTFMKAMFDNGYTTNDFGSDDPLVTGSAYGAIKGPWSIGGFRQKYPDILDEIVIGPMIGQTKSDGLAATFADTKGLVVFEGSEVQDEAWEFLKWVFMNDDLSALWLEKTGLPPARGDLTTSDMFSTYYAEHPLAAAYAEYVGVAVPPAMITTTIDVQKIMGVQMTEPMIFGTKDVATALSDSITAINALLESN